MLCDGWVATVPRKNNIARPDGRWAQLLDGRLTVADLDDEELAKGRCRAADGSFSGRPPVDVPREIYTAMRARLIERAHEMFAEALPEAIQAMVAIAQDPSVKEADRLKAIQMVTDRILGKTPDKVEVSQGGDKPWQIDIAGILRDTE
jgi:hypothetical protein